MYPYRDQEYVLVEYLFPRNPYKYFGYFCVCVPVVPKLLIPAYKKALLHLKLVL